MTVAPQAETEIVNGIIQGIVQKGTDDYGNPNKWQVEVNIGKQNPRRLWSSDPGLIQQLIPMVGQQQSFLCGVSHWTNNQNQPVRSLWINGVGPGAAVPQAPMVQQPVAPPPVAPQPPAQQPVGQQAWPQQFQNQIQQLQQPTVVQPTVAPMGPVAQLAPPQSSWDQKEDRIHRQTATKVASILISHVPAEQRTLDNVLALAERLVAYYENGLAQAVMQQPGFDGDPGPQGIPQDDSDIPF